MDRASLDDPARGELLEWLGDQLEEERFAQLDRAGHDPNDRIPLARVLVDLPIARSPLAEKKDDAGTKDVLAALCQEDPELFQRLSTSPQRGARDMLEIEDMVDRGVDEGCAVGGTTGIVLVGGPGQGKSTITQSLCALHHAAWLSPHTDRLSVAAAEAVESIAAAQRRVAAPEEAHGSESTGRHDDFQSPAPPLPTPATLRFPLRIVLPEAAAWLHSRKGTAKEMLPSLLFFAAERAANVPVSVGTLAAILGEADWLLILDGLDEVPASEARSAVLSAARALIDWLRERRPSGLVVATTRPQGYSGELDRWAELQTWYLLPLGVDDARRYAGHLVRARYDGKRGERILTRLSEAAASAATARLLRTPLQTTILVALIARIGRAPGERWSLFSEYYRIIYEREMERDLPAAELLRRYRPFIDRIHAHVGLLLQVEAELSEGTDATMTPARLRDVMHAVFAEQGMDAARRQGIIDELLKAITERLVLLVERRAGHVGFEIRPLQEMMAAWALGQKEGLIEERLLRVAKSDAHREVVLFIASKAFAELSDVRDVLVDRVLPALNEDPEEPLATAVLLGSVLAIDILADGAALSQPKYVERLCETAARLLKLPPSELLPRLARASMADSDAAAVAAPLLLEIIKGTFAESAAPEESLSAWCLLIGLVDAGSELARRFADEHVDELVPQMDALASILRITHVLKSSWLQEVVLQRVESLPESNAYDQSRRHHHLLAARANLGQTPTGLDDPAVWDTLQLPMPRPERRSVSDRAPEPPAERRPIVIDELSLRNFRGIQELQLKPSPPDNGHGQWIILLGQNGLGKTTLLRALALSLFDLEDPVRRPLPPTAYNAAWLRFGAGADDPAFVRVKLRGKDLDNGVDLLSRDDLARREKLRPIGRPPAEEMIFAYGVHRRSLVSDPTRAVISDLYALVPSLFEEGADLLPIEESLAPLESAWYTQPESVEGRLHIELRAALKELLRVDEIERRGQELWVRGKNTGNVPLKELSDGYLTLASWVVDLVLRWWHQAKRWKIEPAKSVLESMTGLVLIDEIDLFLHPDWQRSVVKTLKKLLPRMSFVVTTHNPLAILGDRANEIWILRRGEGGAIRAEQRDQEPFRLTGSDLYDLFFGIESTLPDEIGQMLYRYRQLASDPYRSPAEDAEANKLLSDLREREMDPGYEPMPIEDVPPCPRISDDPARPRSGAEGAERGSRQAPRRPPRADSREA